MPHLHVLDYEELLRALEQVGFTAKVIYEISVSADNSIRRHPAAIVWHGDHQGKHPQHTRQAARDAAAQEALSEVA